MNRVRVASVGVNFNNLVGLHRTDNRVRRAHDHRNVLRKALEHLQQNRPVVVFVHLLDVVHDQQLDGLVVGGRQGQADAQHDFIQVVQLGDIGIQRGQVAVAVDVVAEALQVLLSGLAHRHEPRLRPGHGLGEHVLDRDGTLQQVDLLHARDGYAGADRLWLGLAEYVQRAAGGLHSARKNQSQGRAAGATLAKQVG